MERSPRGAPPSELASPSSGSSSSSSAMGMSPAQYPTTFVEADPSSFKQVVQMLTGSSETSKLASQSHPSPPTRPVSKSKLYERRNTLRISPLLPGFRNTLLRGPPDVLSPSLLDFPSLALSPVTPLISDPFNNSNTSVFIDTAAEDKAIAHKAFFLHPSPRHSDPPKLLPLFPLTSPNHSGSSTS